MTIIKLELIRGRTSLIIWSLAIAFMLGLCIIIYPQMSSQMGDISSSFASMGDFSAAFGMDRINYGEYTGYFGIECGNILGLGGAFFAALLGISALAKEQKEHTAEFLLTHPVKRSYVCGMKLLAVVIQVVILNLVSFAVSALCSVAIGVLHKKHPAYAFILPDNALGDCRADIRHISVYKAGKPWHRHRSGGRILFYEHHFKPYR